MLIIFGILKKKLGPQDDSSGKMGPILKGNLERLTLFIGMMNGFPHIIIAFAALKLGTRLHDDDKNPISNDYFLTGNLISLFMAIIYTIVTRQLLMEQVFNLN